MTQTTETRTYRVIDTRTDESAGEYDATSPEAACAAAYAEVGDVECGPELSDLTASVVVPEAARKLIARSIQQDEIVHAPASRELHEALMAECDDWVETGSAGSEYWGTEDGSEWRVHLDEPEDTDDDGADRAEYDV